MKDADKFTPHIPNRTGNWHPPGLSIIIAGPCGQPWNYTPAKKLENYLRISTNEVKDFARLTGYRDVHQMNPGDLCTMNSELSDYTGIRHG